MPSHRLKPAVVTWSSPPPSLRKKTSCCPGLHGSKPHGRFYRDTTSESCLSLGSLSPRLQDVSFLKHFPGYFPRASVASEGKSGPWAIWIATGDQDAIGRAKSQSPLWGDEAAKNDADWDGVDKLDLTRAWSAKIPGRSQNGCFGGLNTPVMAPKLLDHSDGLLLLLLSFTLGRYIPEGG